MKKRWVAVSLALILMAAMVAGFVAESNYHVVNATKVCQRDWSWSGSAVLVGRWDVKEWNGVDVMDGSVSLSCFDLKKMYWFWGDEYKLLY